MRIELKIGLLMNTLGIIASRSGIFPVNLTEFLSGAFFGLGLFFIVLNFLPEQVCDKLLYRKLLKSKNG